MIEQLKKALTTGVGLALKTWAEVEVAGKEMIKKAQLSEKDAGQLLKNLKESYEKTQEKMEVAGQSPGQGRYQKGRHCNQ